MTRTLARAVLIVLLAAPARGQQQAVCDMADSVEACRERHDQARALAFVPRLQAAAAGPAMNDSMRAAAAELCGTVYLEAHLFEEALEPCRSAAAVWTRCAGAASPGALRSTAAWVRCELERGEADSAGVRARVLLDLLRASGDSTSTLSLLASTLQGRALIESGHLLPGEASLLSVLARTARDEMLCTQARREAAIGLARLYRDMGRYEDAELLLRKLIVEEETHCPTLFHRSADPYNWLGLILKNHARSRRWPDAEAPFVQALALLTAQGDSGGVMYVSVLGNLAGLYGRLGRAEEALRMQQQVSAAEVATLGPRDYRHGITLQAIGILYQKLGRPEDAEPCLREAASIGRAHYGPHHQSYRDLLGYVARVCAVLGRYPEADSLFEEVLRGDIAAIHTLEPLLTERDLSSLMSALTAELDAYYSAMDRRSDTRPAATGDMYNLRLASKGMLVRARLRTRERILTSGDTALIRDYHRWCGIRESIAEGTGYGGSMPDTGRYRRLVDSAEVLERSLARRSAAFSRTFVHPWPDWRAVRSRLRRGEAAVEIVSYDDCLDVCDGTHYRYIALVLTRASGAPAIVRLGRADEMHGTPLEYYRSRLASGDDALSWQRYWAPLQRALDGVRRVYFSGDGVYQLINPAALRMPDGSYLGDRVEVRLLSSTSDLLPGPAAPHGLGRSTPFILGGPVFDTAPSASPPPDSTFERTGLSLPRPLPGAAGEILDIDTLLRASAQWDSIAVFTGLDASERRVKAVRGPRVLHLATHGYFLEPASVARRLRTVGVHFPFDDQSIAEQPLLRSGLLLAGAGRTLRTGLAADSGDDGLLTALEVMNLDLEGTDLVVLSACESGRGHLLSGEGVYGLQRAFKVAGARAVLMSLWPVHDAITRDLMRAFYAEWLKTGDAHRALTAAERRIRRVHPEPLYWAPFVLVGTP